MVSITEICRNMRKSCTPAENTFWQMVRNRNFMDLKFNRQYPIVFEYEDVRRFFIADFYCHELKLIVEIDGGIHESQKDYDELRTAILNDLGYQVIRFKNEDVFHNIDQVESELLHFIENTSPMKIENLAPLLLKEKGPGDES